MKIRNIALLIIALCFASCVNEPYWPDTEEANGARYTLFDFCSTFECSVDLSLGQREFVYIYTQDPAQNPYAEAVRTLWTDGNGEYRCSLTLPTALIGKEIYAYTSNGIIKAKVTDKGATFSGRPAAVSRTEEHGALHPTTDLCLNIKNSFLSRMDRGADNLSKLVETGEIAIQTKEDNTQVLFTFLHSYGWNSNFMYYYYYKGEDPINSKNRDEYINKICNDPEDRFLCTRGWGIQVNNDEGNNPEEDDVTILTTSGSGGINLRFCDIDGKPGYGVGSVAGNDWTPCEYAETSGSETKNIKSMMGISNHLYFYGDIDLNREEYDEALPFFPKGYKIGLILKSVKHTERRNLDNPDPENVNYYFTNPNLNKPDMNNNRIHAGRFWSIDESNSFSRFVYGFEDSFKVSAAEDYNFTDFLCMVSTDPIANLVDVKSLTSTDYSVSGTLLFEDLFPIQGDYDMNDIIVEYRKVKDFEVYKFKDGREMECIKNFYIELTPVHYGATYDDYLYVTMNPKNTWRLLPGPQPIDFQAKTGMSLKSAAIYNERQIVAGNPKDLKTVTLYVIKDWVPYNQPTRGVALTDEQVPFSDLEVFLYVKDTNREVHITDHQCVGVNGSSNADLDGYMRAYKAKQGPDEIFLPWAMDIPIRSDSHGYRGFIPVTEGVKITDEYLSFFDWYNGDKSKAWYENKYHTPKR